MAYKDKRKNKAHIRSLHKQLRRKKSAKKKRRADPLTFLTESERK